MKLFLLLTSCLVSIISVTQPLITFQQLATGLSQPLDIVPHGSSIFVVEKAGTIRIWNGSSVVSRPFLNITSLVKSTGGEQGLLSMAFHPNYATNGYFYVYYTNLNDDVVIARYSRIDALTADSLSGVSLMTIYKPFLNHNGGKLLFGPDSYLYFGTGDGGSGGDPGNRAQNGDSILGKMIRIDVSNSIQAPYYTIPPTNPYINNPNIRDEIIALGLRNPWRWSFDKQTGDMWLADVGQNAWEEVNIVPAAAILDKNYGWPCYEGTTVYKPSCSAQPNNVFPVFEYPHNNQTGGFSVTGGYRYRGAEYPFLQGYYLTADFVSGKGWLLYQNGSGGWNSTMQTWINGISSFGEDAAGNLYAATLGGGSLYKIVASDPLPVKLLSFSGKQVKDQHEFQFTVQQEEPGDIYLIERRVQPTASFETVHTINATTTSVSKRYSTALPATTTTTFYRLRIMSRNGQQHFSQIVALAGVKSNSIKAVINGSRLVLSHPTGARKALVYDAVGRLIISEKINSTSAQTTVDLPGAVKGIITVIVETDLGRGYLRLFY